MNVLGLIFSVLTVLLFSFCAIFCKQIESERIRSSFVGHIEANRKLINSCEQERYRLAPGESTRASPSSGVRGTQQKKEQKKLPPNPSCAKLNLWPLVQKGREENPLLYKAALSLIGQFYGELLAQEQQELFLQALLEALKKALHKQPAGFPLEKLAFRNAASRKVYYKMLKGSKEYKFFEGVGYPPLLDYIKVEESSRRKLCLFHADLYALSLFLGPDVAQKLHHTIHTEGGPPLTQQLVEQLCSEAHILLKKRELFDLLQFKSCKKTEPVTSFTGKDEETGIYLKKQILLKS